MGRHEPAEEEAEESEVGRRREDKPAEHHGDSVAGELDQVFAAKKKQISGLICKKSSVAEEYEDVLEQQRTGVLQRYQGFHFQQPLPDLKFPSNTWLTLKKKLI